MAAALPFQSVVVTGAEGLVGRTLVRALHGILPENARLALFSREPCNTELGTRCLVDLLDKGRVFSVIGDQKPDLVIHLAAQSSVAGEAQKTWAVNCCGTLNLAAACASADFKGTFLFASTAEVYGKTFLVGPATEDAPLAPLSSYARSKAAAEALLGDVLLPSTQLIVLRPGNHSGPGQDGRFVLPSFAAQIAALEHSPGPAELRVGNLSAERDFTALDDVVDAYVAVLQHASALGSRVVLNVGSGQPASVGNLLEALLALTPKKFSIVPDPLRQRPSEVSRAAIDVSRIAALTGWKAKRPLEELLRELLDYERQRLLVEGAGSAGAPAHRGDL